MKIENIYPSSIHIKYDYIKVNDMYVAGIIISELASKIDIFDMNKIIPQNTQNTVSIHIKKLDLQRQVRNLSRIISETGSEIKSINPNQQDINIISKIHDEATMLRKKIQVENEELYHINIYIKLSDVFLDKLKMKIRTIISELYTNGILSKIANFRHEEVYLNSLPICKKSLLNTQSGIDVTTSQLAYLIPYVTENIYDEKGILYGFIQNSVCMYDIFSRDNLNYNMCVLGSSRSREIIFYKNHNFKKLLHEYKADSI